MSMGRRVLAAGVITAFVLTSCGGSDSADDDPVGTSTATSDAETEPSEDFTPTEGEDDVPLGSAPSDDTTGASTPGADSVAPDATGTAGATTQPGATDGGTPAGDAVVATLMEWSIDAPTEYAAGDVTFTATNDGNFPHEFVVIRGDGYESLPLAEGGAIIEEELPDGALIDRTDRLSGGSSADLTVTLEPGNYVLVCNLGGGANSHAGQGQNLDITVS